MVFMKYLCMALLFAISLIASFPAFAQTMPLSLSGCAGGDTIIVQLPEGPAFRLPPDKIKFGPLMPPNTDPAAPQYGCPGNPVVTSVISTAISVPESLLTGAPSKRAFVQGIWVNSDKIGPPFQHSNLAMFRSFKKIYSECEITAEGLEYCYNCKLVNGLCTAQTIGASKRSASYAAMAKPGVYDGSDHMPFSMLCSHVADSTKVVPDFENCGVSYATVDGLNITYDIKNPLVPRNHIIAYDREIRRQLLSYRAPEYDGAVIWIRK
jgi:hypothetical protein